MSGALSPLYLQEEIILVNLTSFKRYVQTDTHFFINFIHKETCYNFMCNAYSRETALSIASIL